MATRIAAQNLTVGGSASGTAWAATPEQVSITFQATQVVADSVVRCLILDNANRVLKSTILNGSSTKKLTVEGLETNINVRMEQLQGSAQVTASDGTGGDITADEIATDAVGTAEIAAGAVDTEEIAAGALSADAAGRAKIADDFFTAAEFAAGAGGKFAANALVAAGIANLIGDDAFTAANMSKFATDSITAAVAADIIQDGAIVEAHRDGTPTAITDPGDGNTITPATSGDVICTIDVGTGAETRDLGVPDHIGQRLTIVGGTFGGGTLTITVAAGFKDDGAAGDVATITTGDVMILEACGAAATDWRCTSSNGVAFA